MAMHSFLQESSPIELLFKVIDLADLPDTDGVQCLFMALLTYCSCPSHSRLTPTHLTHSKCSYLPSFPPWPMQTSKPHQGTRSGELSFLQQGYNLLHLPAKPSYSCKQHAKIACCPLCVPVPPLGLSSSSSFDLPHKDGVNDE